MYHSMGFTNGKQALLSVLADLVSWVKQKSLLWGVTEKKAETTPMVPWPVQPKANAVSQRRWVVLLGVISREK